MKLPLALHEIRDNRRQQEAILGRTSLSGCSHGLFSPRHSRELAGSPFPLMGESSVASLYA
ncbi:unnamed protein product [Penicillium camemberti]|uniref:Str. FM013 n=1 Tax=Penicillium camemberti (strain FM 013) TaxID=1429867 RepID=A0A0G4P0R3_PENC3|nr:unnamed protein product [Penicillium camemberti]